jgi:hypothetical protein
MGTGARVFFVEDDDRLTHISLKRWEDLVRNGEGAKPFPEYAGQSKRQFYREGISSETTFEISLANNIKQQ